MIGSQGQSGPSRQSPAVASFLERIGRREVCVGIIGQGYVGLPLALVFSENGFDVVGFDQDVAKVEALSRGESYIKHIGAERVDQARRRTSGQGAFRATTAFHELAACDAVLICVPTPLGPHREPDLSYVFGTGHQVAANLRPGQLVVLESTTYPGTTDEELLPILESSGLSCPGDFLVAFSPEREDPGNPDFSTRNIPKVVGGVNEESTEAAVALYSAVMEQVVPVSSSRVAEATKLLENVYRAVNIALVNELKITFDRMGIDVWEVIEAAKTKPFGYHPFYPGPGLGGHCIPLDPFYLTWKAAEYGMWTRFIELAGEINTSMPRYVAERTAEALSQDGKSVKGATVLVLGLSYKANIDDDRESPSYEIMELLSSRGAEVSYCDPFFPVAGGTRRHPARIESVPCTAEEFGRYDVLVVSTGHEAFADGGLYANASLVVDTRNIVPAGAGCRVVKA